MERGQNDNEGQRFILIAHLNINPSAAMALKTRGRGNMEPKAAAKRPDTAPRAMMYFPTGNLSWGNKSVSAVS